MNVSENQSDEGNVGERTPFVEEETTEIEREPVLKSNDVGQWPTLTDDDISYWIHNDPTECQHWDDTFQNSKRGFKDRF